MTHATRKPWSDHALENQWVTLRRSFVAGGGLAALWRLDAGLTISVLPVALLLARGYRDGLVVSEERLGWLSGVSPRSAVRSMKALHAAMLVDLREIQRGGGLKYAATSRALPMPGDQPHSFVVRGELVSCGAWRELPRCARSVLLALASMPPYRANWEDAEAGLFDDLDKLGNLPPVPVHRAGMTSCAQLSALTGLDRASVSRGLCAVRLARGGDVAVPLAYLRPTKRGTMYQLPARWWKPG